MTRPALAAIALTLGVSLVTPALAQDLVWTRQAGTSQYDVGSGVAVDEAGHVYLTGATYGGLDGPNAGFQDAFVLKYNAAGGVLWTRQVGTSHDDASTSVAVDGAGGVVIAGYTSGGLGGPNAGGTDGFLVKHDASGALRWARQIGTAQDDLAYGVAADSAGNVYLVGQTEGALGGPNAGKSDVFLAKYDASGLLLWTRQPGTAGNDYGYGVAVDGAGNVYIAGSTEGGLGGPNAGFFDAFVAKYGPSGVLLWTRQIGTPGFDSGRGLAVDQSGNAYVAGTTPGDLGGTNAGGADAFLAKFDPSGALLWARQLGTSADDVGYAVAVDRAGNAYLTGFTRGGLAAPNAGDYDAFLARYDPSGALLWTRQIGTTHSDAAHGVAVNGASNVYVTGTTSGSLGAPNAGGDDSFLAKFGPSLCLADFDHDGFVTGNDFDSFVLAFVSGDAAADFDHNGFVTGDDFDAYVAAFEAGC